MDFDLKDGANGPPTPLAAHERVQDHSI